MLRLQGRYGKALADFKDGLLRELGDEIQSIVVYGSVAREEAGEGSHHGWLVRKGFGGDLSKAFEMRQASTYDIYASFGEEGVGEIVDNAERSIKHLGEINDGDKFLSLIYK